MLTKIAGWALIAFAVYYLVTDPAGAAGVVLGVVHGRPPAPSHRSPATCRKDYP